jgi:hypothetical protein
LSECKEARRICTAAQVATAGELSCSAGFLRSQSGVKFPLPSFHERVAVCAKVEALLVPM